MIARIQFYNAPHIEIELKEANLEAYVKIMRCTLEETKNDAGYKFNLLDSEGFAIAFIVVREVTS